MLKIFAPEKVARNRRACRALTKECQLPAIQFKYLALVVGHFKVKLTIYMDPQEAVVPLEKLHQKLETAEGVEAYILFGTIKAISDLAFDWCEQNPEKETMYTQEKLGLFFSYCHNAVFPHQESHKTPHEWWSSAGDNLMKVKITDIRDKP